MKTQNSPIGLIITSRIKRSIFLFLFFSMCLTLQAQTLIELNFTAEDNNGNWVLLDSVLVENISQGGDTTLYYPDTILSFSYVGVEEQPNLQFGITDNFPNPFKNETTIQIEMPQDGIIELQFVDISARNVIKQNILLNSGQNSVRLRFGKSGNYIVSANWKNKKRSVKVSCRGGDESYSSINVLEISNLSQSNKYRLDKSSTFNLGDNLRFTGFGNNSSNTIYDVFGVSTYYSFNLHIPGINCPALFSDVRDGNVYSAVQIGNQCWMKENLAYLPSVFPSSASSTTMPRAYVYGYQGYDTILAKATGSYEVYGVLYNWPAAIEGDSSSNAVPSGVQGVCPTGWHLPSDNEWDTLINYLGGASVAGGKMKETGFNHWNSPNTGATNSSNFSALPGGERNASTSVFLGLGNDGRWWSSTQSVGYFAYGRYLYSVMSGIGRSDYDMTYGISVRCVKD